MISGRSGIHHSCTHLTVVDEHPVAELLRHTIRWTRVERSRFLLGNFLYLTVQLRSRCLCKKKKTLCWAFYFVPKALLFTISTFSNLGRLDDLMKIEIGYQTFVVLVEFRTPTGKPATHLINKVKPWSEFRSLANLISTSCWNRVRAENEEVEKAVYCRISWVVFFTFPPFQYSKFNDGDEDDSRYDDILLGIIYIVSPSVFFSITRR